MAQVINDNGVQTQQTAGWGAHILREGPRFMLYVAGLLIGAFILVRLFVGEFVTDYKIALLLTVVSCAFIAILVGGIPALIWIIRETSKASVAGVAQQVSETNQLVRSSIEQNSAVMGALIQITGQTMNRTPIQINAPAQAQHPTQVARADLVKAGDNQMISRDMLINMATDIYNRMYLQQIPPTQDNVRRLCNITSNGHISKALDVLAGWGMCTLAQQGKEREWIYGEGSDAEA